MKRVFLVFLTVMLLSGVAFAHSGGTDSQGGHRDSTTGVYHFHHGFPAHQHQDGVCPYENPVTVGTLESAEPDMASQSSRVLTWFGRIYVLSVVGFVLWNLFRMPKKSFSEFVFWGLFLTIISVGLIAYWPLLVIGFVSDKFHSSGHSVKGLGFSVISFIKRHYALIKVTALILIIISVFVGYGLAEKTGNLWFLLPFAILLVYALWFLIKEKLS